MEGGDARVKFSVASNYKEDVTWFNVTAFGKQAESINQYLRKGSAVLIEGRINTYKYTGDDGIERHGWGVTANNVRFLSGGGGDAGEANPDDPFASAGDSINL